MANDPPDTRPQSSCETWFVPFRLALGVLTLLLIAAEIQMKGAAHTQTVLGPRSEPVSRLFFGLHVHRADADVPWPSASFGSWRLWDANVAWPSLEPERSRWAFDRLDKDIALAEQHRVRVLLVLGLSPPWASARPQEPSAYSPGCAAEPKDIQDWRTYISTVALRYKGRIHEYEIWNEPNLRNFYSGSVSQMVSLTRETCHALKQIDPSIQVISPAATGTAGLEWLEQFLRDGGGDCVDVIGYHFYVTPGPPEDAIELVTKVREIMSRYGVSEKPLWNTEFGWFVQDNQGKAQSGSGSFKKTLTQEEASEYVARSYLLDWAAGLDRAYWYAWDDGPMGLADDDGRAVRRSADVYGRIQQWLLGARLDSCAEGQDLTWICGFHREPNRLAWIVWNADRMVIFKVPTEWKVRQATDLSGRLHAMKNTGEIEIGPSPLLLADTPPIV